MKKITYINNNYINHNKAVVSVEDRGLLFSDSIYELISVFNSKIIDLNLHLIRLFISLKKIKIKPNFSKKKIETILKKLIKYNSLKNGYIYIQVTRGTSERKHEFPSNYKPTLIVFTKNLNIDEKIYKKGVKVITLPDLRWLRRDIKSTSLLPNILAKQNAFEKGALEAWLIDDGYITEGSASNAWIIQNSNKIITHPVNNKILNGITRQILIKILKKNNFLVIEKPFNLIQAKNSKEAFLTSSTMSVVPIIKIDNFYISNGKPGETTKKIIKLYNYHINQEKIKKNLLNKELKIA